MEGSMGFFDDLDAEVPAVTDEGSGGGPGGLDAVFDKLTKGWRFETAVVRRKSKDRMRGLTSNQETEVWFEGGRFVVVTRLVERRGDAYSEIQNETKHSLDRQGLIELLDDRPLLSQKLLEAAGVKPAASSEDLRGF